MYILTIRKHFVIWFHLVNKIFFIHFLQKTKPPMNFKIATRRNYFPY